MRSSLLLKLLAEALARLIASFPKLDCHRTAEPLPETRLDLDPKVGPIASVDDMIVARFGLDDQETRLGE